MQEKPSVMDVLKCSWVEDAIEILDSLSAEDVLLQDISGVTVLHQLCFGRQVQPFSFDIEPVIEKIITKNPNILCLKWNDLGTPIEMAIREDDLRAVKILLPYYRKFKEEVVMHETEAVWRMKKRKAKVKEVIVTESHPLLFTAKNRLHKVFYWLFKKELLSMPSLFRDRSYHPDFETKAGLQKIYNDVLRWGNSRLVLKALHQYLGYYEGRDGENCNELYDLISNDGSFFDSSVGRRAFQLISQGHYIYNFSDELYGGRVGRFIIHHTISHPNYNVRARDKFGNTTLHALTRDYRGDKLGRLIGIVEHDIGLLKELLAPNSDGDNPAHLIFKNTVGDGTHIFFLIKAIEKNAELMRMVFTPDIDGNTLLHLAVKRGKVEEVKLLLKCDAVDVLAQNSEGLTVLDIARVRSTYERLECAKLIEAHIKAKENQARLHAAIDFVSRVCSFVFQIFTGAAKAYSGDIEIEIDMPTADLQIKKVARSKGRCAA
jgi:ankyrin repeat protein